MKLKKSEWAIILFNVIYIIAFSIYYISIKNYEFLIYISVIVLFFALILLTFRKSKFDYLILWGLSIWGFLHLAGGGIKIGEGVLYNLHLINIAGSGELYILKFDQVVHFLGFGVATLVGYHLLKPYLNEKTNWKVVYPLLICIGMGLGAFNEIAEFIAVISVPDTNVGGYYNTALDLIFNFFGSIAAVIIIHFRRKRKVT